MTFPDLSGLPGVPVPAGTTAGEARVLQTERLFPVLAAKPSGCGFPVWLAFSSLAHLSIVAAFVLLTPAPEGFSGLNTVPFEVVVVEQVPTGPALAALDIPLAELPQEPVLPQDQPAPPPEPPQLAALDIPLPELPQEPVLPQDQPAPPPAPPQRAALAIPLPELPPEPVLPAAVVAAAVSATVQPRDPPQIRQTPRPPRNVDRRKPAQPATRPPPRRARTSAASPSVARAARPAAASTGDIASYRRTVASRLAARKRYPETARFRGAAGVAVVSFRIASSGRVATVAIARSSGHADLDAATVAMVRRAAPFPAPPRGAPTSFSVPVAYNLD